MITWLWTEGRWRFDLQDEIRGALGCFEWWLHVPAQLAQVALLCRAAEGGYANAREDRARCVAGKRALGPYPEKS